MKTIILMAITVDGKIAKSADHFTNWTSQADKKMFVAKTKEAGVMVMGNTTYQTIGRPLPGRLNLIMTRSDKAAEAVPGLLEFTKAEPVQIVKDVEARGFAEMIVCGGSTINGLFLQAALVDELWLTIEPKLFGSGLGLCGEIDLNLDLELLENPERLGDNSILLKYMVVK